MTPKSIKKLRSKAKLNYNFPVVILSRSNKNVSAQVLDNLTKNTLATFTSYKITKQSKTQKSETVGVEVGKYLLSKKINKVVIDRNGLLYHGRIKALVNSIRTQGIEI
jgi:large subunit ribosomal protein L18